MSPDQKLKEVNSSKVVFPAQKNGGSLTAPAPQPQEEAGEGKSSVAMHIVTGSMQFKLDTVVDHSRVVVELAAKLDLALALLTISEGKLADAMKEIGKLQEQLNQARPDGSM